MRINKAIILTLICLLSFSKTMSQDFGDFPKIEKNKLLNDLELLYQGLDKFHTGMYWYTPKDSVDSAFKEVRAQIDKDMNVLEFHRLIAPLVALSREGHTDIDLPKEISAQILKENSFLPMTVVFLGTKLYCVRNGTDYKDIEIQGKEIETINGEKPIDIATEIGALLNGDGFIKTGKLSYLEGFNFSKNYFLYYGEQNAFQIKFKGIEETVTIKALKIEDINKNLVEGNKLVKTKIKKDLLEYKILNISTAYLDIHSFSNSEIKEDSQEKNLIDFLENSFKSISDNNIKNLIVDVSQNGGGTEGNEGILYSYFGEDYQKYLKVRAKTQKAILDNGIDKPITLKTFGFLERTFANKKMQDGSLERKEWIGFGLMAYKKAPKHQFKGKVYVLIGPATYSGGSEFANMMYTNDIGTFVGQETGGGYYGNTSGYSKELILPNSKIEVDLPALQFMMNVKTKIPFGRGVIPHHEVVPTFEQYKKGENAALEFVMEMIESEN